MTLYNLLAARVGSLEARMLADQLSAWHDDMVLHRRRALRDPGSEPCSGDCPFHAAPHFWHQARRVFGRSADELLFLRSVASPSTGRAPARGAVGREALAGPG